MKKIFVDTGPFQALNNKKDEYFNLSIHTLQSLRGKKVELVTTDYILDEVYTGLLMKAGYNNAMNFDREVKRQVWRIEYITDKRFSKAQVVFRRFNRDKTWSFTDCTSLIVMKELKIKIAFTFDEHFRQMGFTRIP